MKKVLLFFAVMMMAITASAKVYEVSFEKSKNITIYGGGNTRVINGVKITVNEGSIQPAPSWEPQTKGHMWNGRGTENDFQISTENGETITNIEITTEEESKWSICDLCGTGWTKIAKGISWTGSATSVKVGGQFEQVIKLTVTVDETTAIKNVETTSSQKAGKFIKDGKLVIVKDGKLYNANGCIVK